MDSLKLMLFRDRLVKGSNLVHRDEPYQVFLLCKFEFWGYQSRR